VANRIWARPGRTSTASKVRAQRPEDEIGWLAGFAFARLLLYICTCMKPYTVSELREHLADALDRAEHGEPVAVARRGRRFRIVADTPTSSPGHAKAFFRVTDLRLLEAGWTWEWTGPGHPLRLRIRRRSKRRR
jgi:antitoxin (DNA-binding transcriptional repressor) of toxin-antitoxin stability system